MKIVETIKNAVKLKEPEPTELSHGWLGYVSPLLRNNPVKLPLLSPVYVPLAFLALGHFAITESYNIAKEKMDFNSKFKKYDYLEELGKNLTSDKHPELFKFLKKNNYDDNRLAFSGLFSSLVEKKNKDALLIVLDNVNLKSKKYEATEEEVFNHLIYDIFTALTYNIKFMENVMDERILQKCADSRKLPFSIDVDYYAKAVPSIIAERPVHSPASTVVRYLRNNFADTFTYKPLGYTKKPKM